ncbi:hypothetical protein ACFE04_014965 [Oxalis oulophora]
MAVGVDNDKPQKGDTNNSSIERKLLLNTKVEVRSLEDGFQGSWHPGTVVGCEQQGKRRIMYDHIFADNLLGKYVEDVVASPTIEGHISAIDCSSYRGIIRPFPPPIDVSEWRLRYGLCVDVYHQDGWWEGVIFDQIDNSEERNVFFPDLGDELFTNINKLRITQDWDEQTEIWKTRGQWLFLELFGQIEKHDRFDHSFKQIWYDVREMDAFKKIKEWTYSTRAFWGEMIMEAIRKTLKETIYEILDEFYISETFEKGCAASLEFSKDELDLILSDTESFEDLDITTHDTLPSEELANNAKPPASIEEVTVNGDTTRSGEIYQQRKKLKARKTDNWNWNWKPAVPHIVAGPEFHPEAIIKYASTFGQVRCPTTLLSDVRKHLLHLGWSIEFCKGKGQPRHRYTSPDKKRYLSLQMVCQILMKSTKEANDNLLRAEPQEESRITGNCSPGGTSSELEFESNSETEVFSKAKPCPEAVVQWYKMDPVEGRTQRSKYKGLISKAKGHLSSLGWVIEQKKMNKSKTSRWTYRSQSGRIYLSLRKACECCIKNGEATEISGSMVQRDLELPTDESKHESQELSIASKLKTLKRRKGKPKGVGKFNKKSALASCRLLTRSKAKKSSKQVKDKMKPDQPTRVLQPTIKVQQEAAPSSSPRAPQSRLALLIERNVLSPGDPLCYTCEVDRSLSTQGKVVRDGIKCLCCGWCFTVSGFETHADSMHQKQLSNKALENGYTHEKPSTSIASEDVSNQDKPSAELSTNMILIDGRTILDGQTQTRSRIQIAEPHGEVNLNWPKGQNDIICSICFYGGELLLCDQCPSSFHQDCLGLKDIPDGDWFCPSCCCRECGGITIKEDEAHTGDDKVVSCYQCDLNYHIKCLDNEKRLELENCSTLNWFCSKGCEKIFLGLKEILGKPFPVGEDNLTWTLMKPSPHDNPKFDASNIEAESNSKLHGAVSLMHECFEPVKDSATGRDLVKDIIFNRWSELNRLNFQGFYTVLLENCNELISAASVRVYGEKVAEIPFVGTMLHHRNHGMCRLLMNVLEKKLVELGVQRLVLPAAPSVVDAWTKSFRFSKMTASERLQFVNHTLVDFQSTVMCHKYLPNPSQESQMCYDVDKSTNPITLDGSNIISEASQVDQLKETPTIEDQGELQNAVVSGSPSDQGKNHLDAEENLDSENVHESSSSGGSLKCYKRRKTSSSSRACQGRSGLQIFASLCFVQNAWESCILRFVVLWSSDDKCWKLKLVTVSISFQRMDEVSCTITLSQFYVSRDFRGNLDERVSDRVLYDILIQAGRVQGLHVPRDRETDKPKGFAFAEYETDEVADYAVKLFSGLVTLYNKTLKFGVAVSTGFYWTHSSGKDSLVFALEPLETCGLASFHCCWISGQDKVSQNSSTPSTLASNSSYKTRSQPIPINVETSHHSTRLPASCRISAYPVDHSEPPPPGVTRHQNGHGSHINGSNYEYSRRVLGTKYDNLSRSRSRHDTSNPIPYPY